MNPSAKWMLSGWIVAVTVLSGTCVPAHSRGMAGMPANAHGEKQWRITACCGTLLTQKEPAAPAQKFFTALPPAPFSFAAPPETPDSSAAYRMKHRAENRIRTVVLRE